MLLILVLYLVLWLYRADFSQGQAVEFGVSFSPKYASQLQLNPYQVLTAILDELKIRKFRLMAYWDEIEASPGNYDYFNLDWQLREIAKRQGEVSLVIGHRLPRWPECHWPAWAYQLTDEQRQQKILELLIKTIQRYKDTSVISSWQVENEPYLRVFGECPKPDTDFYKEEVALVKRLDDRPIVVTESGELSTWLRAGRLADWVGTSIYRITWNKYFGYFYYPLPPAFYNLKTQLVKLLTGVNDVFISEMQMEPWLDRPVVEAPISEQYRSMNADQFQKNINYVKRTGLSPVYLWGVEWWYWLAGQGDASLWQLAEQLGRSN